MLEEQFTDYLAEAHPEASQEEMEDIRRVWYAGLITGFLLGLSDVDKRALVYNEIQSYLQAYSNIVAVSKHDLP